MEPAEPKKQYLVLSLIISLIVSLILHFTIIGSTNTPFTGGFPINQYSLQGVLLFLARIFNTLVIGALLTPLTYSGFMWLVNRGGFLR